MNLDRIERLKPKPALNLLKTKGSQNIDHIQHHQMNMNLMIQRWKQNTKMSTDFKLPQLYPSPYLKASRNYESNKPEYLNDNLDRMEQVESKMIELPSINIPRVRDIDLKYFC